MQCPCAILVSRVLAGAEGSDCDEGRQKRRRVVTRKAKEISPRSNDSPPSPPSSLTVSWMGPGVPPTTTLMQ